MNILNLLIGRLVQIVNNETFTKSVREIINQHNAAIRLTPVAGDGAEADAGDIESETRPAPEHDG